MNLEKEIKSLFHAKTEQIPRLHEVMNREGDAMSLDEHVEVLVGLLKVHREIIIRLAKEIDDLRAA